MAVKKRRNYTQKITKGARLFAKKRLAKKWTQEECKAQLVKPGKAKSITLHAISGIETGWMRPGMDLAYVIWRVMGVPMHTWLEDPDDDDTDE